MQNRDQSHAQQACAKIADFQKWLTAKRPAPLSREDRFLSRFETPPPIDLALEKYIPWLKAPADPKFARSNRYQKAAI